MLKKILIGLGIVIALLAVAATIFIKISTSKSPAATAGYTQQGLDIKVAYCQPSKKGRVIFAEKTDAQKAVCPYNEVWRTGANEATKITFAQDVTFAGKPLKAGVYTLWTIPNASTWTVIINGETGQWGTNYDVTKDVLRIDVPSNNAAPLQELFKISFVGQADGTDMVLAWDTVAVTVPIKK